jgi:hypothetical protein
MQMHEADIVEDAAVVAGAIAVRLIASRACAHSFVPICRPHGQPPTGFPRRRFTTLPPRACEFRDGFIDWFYGRKGRISSSSTKGPI